MSLFWTVFLAVLVANLVYGFFEWRWLEEWFNRLNKNHDAQQEWLMKRLDRVDEKQEWLAQFIDARYPKQRSLTELDKVLGTDPSGPAR
jgi:hypothetical protein